MKKNMKQAAIDQILLWIMLFTVFVSLLFFVIEYSTAMRIKDNVDALADYGARMIALGRSEADIVTGMNNIKLDGMATIQEADLNCVEDGSTSNYQVQFTVQTTYNSDFISNNTIEGKTVVFNEVNDAEKTCSITLVVN